MTIRTIRLRVSAARCCRSHSSGTKTNRRDAGHFVAGDLDVDSRLALRQRRERRVGERERPVGPRLQLRGRAETSRA